MNTEPTTSVNPSEALTALMTKMQAWLNDLVAMLPNLILAIVIVLIAVFISKHVGKLVKGAMNKATSYGTLNSLAATVAQVVVSCIGFFVALGILGLDKTVTSLLAGAGVIGLALAFAFQDIAGNFMSGILLALRRPFSNGDIIETNDFFGVVEDVNLRSTIVRTPQGQMVVIPNSSVLQNPIKNFSKMGSRAHRSRLRSSLRRRPRQGGAGSLVFTRRSRLRGPRASGGFLLHGVWRQFDRLQAQILDRL